MVTARVRLPRAPLSVSQAKGSTMDTAQVIERDERRAARDRWRAAGGSQRRALHTFATEAEKRERRAELKAERLAACEAIRTDDGVAAEWTIACMLNPHLGANNAALVAVRLPGQVVGTARYWRKIGARINKGESAAMYLTGGPHTKFAPVAAFAACQTSAAHELAAVEDRSDGRSDDIPF